MAEVSAVGEGHLDRCVGFRVEFRHCYRAGVAHVPYEHVVGDFDARSVRRCSEVAGAEDRIVLLARLVLTGASFFSLFS